MRASLYKKDLGWELRFEEDILGRGKWERLFEFKELPNEGQIGACRGDAGRIFARVERNARLKCG